MLEMFKNEISYWVYFVKFARNFISVNINKKRFQLGETYCMI